MINIVRETLDTLLEFLPNVIKETKKTAEYFHTDREAEALNIMIEITDAYIWVIDAIKGIKINGHLLNINEDEVKDYLIEIEKAMTNQDYIAVSDLLEYEIAEIFEKWYGEIQLEIEDK